MEVKMLSKWSIRKLKTLNCEHYREEESPKKARVCAQKNESKCMDEALQVIIFTDRCSIKMCYNLFKIQVNCWGSRLRQDSIHDLNIKLSIPVRALTFKTFNGRRRCVCTRVCPWLRVNVCVQCLTHVYCVHVNTDECMCVSVCWCVRMLL